MADQLELVPDATPPGVYRPRGISSLQRLFRVHFPEVTVRYDAEFAERLTAAGREIQSATVIAYASAGDFVRSNPHLHGIFLEGGFDRHGRFVHVPSLDLGKLAQCFRAIMVALFRHRELINKRFGKNMLDWTHSGFSVDLSVRIPATSAKTREALAQYIPGPAAGRSPARGARPPVSLKKMLVDEGGGGVLYRSEYNPFFRTDARLFPAVEFLVQLLQHLPEPRARLIRRYGLYSSRSRGTWSRKPCLVRLAPEGWKREHDQHSSLRLGEHPQDNSEVYEVDALRCPRCASRMRVLPVITDPQQVRRILRHLIKTGASPPGLDPTSLS